MIDDLSARQRFALNFLGYKRFLPREMISKAKEALSSPAPVDDFSKEKVEDKSLNKAQVLVDKKVQVFSECSSTENLEFSDKKVEIKPYDFEFGRFFDGQFLSVIEFKEIDFLFVFPPLWHKKERFSLFAFEEERALLLQAFFYSNFKSWQFPLKSALSLEFEEAPRMREMVLNFSSQIKGIVAFVPDFYMGLMREFLPDLPIYFVTHPRLALLSGEFKRKLWLDLLALRA